MKKIVLLLILSISLFAGRYNIDETIFTSNNWAKPLHRSLITSTNYDYESQIYYNNHGFWHGAVDIIANLNEKVYSIAEGKVVAIYRKTASTNNMSVIYIKYKSSDNTEFLVIYGHTYAKNELKVDDIVKKDEYIGNIKRYGSPDHVHFGITTNLNYHGPSFGSSISWTGVVNPLDFLSSHSNSNNSNTSSSNNVGIFDGAGSLVSPNESCWGCDKDEARMHPHPGTGSTVVFQWLYDSDTCSQIDLVADSDIEVAVKAKAWDKHLTQKAFKVTLGKNPVTLKRPSDNSWTTLAITSIKPINYMTPIYAYCKTPSDSYHSGNRESINKELVDVTYDYFWTGTGSLITQADARSFDNAGIGIDYATTFKTKNSLTSFQWYASQKCSKVKIKGYNENSSSVNGVYIKGWAEKNWSSNKCSSLPCTLTAPSTDAYYIIKVKSSPNAIKSGYLQTECIQ